MPPRRSTSKTFKKYCGLYAVLISQEVKFFKYQNLKYSNFILFFILPFFIVKSWRRGGGSSLLIRVSCMWSTNKTVNGGKFISFTETLVSFSTLKLMIMFQLLLFAHFLIKIVLLIHPHPRPSSPFPLFSALLFLLLCKMYNVVIDFEFPIFQMFPLFLLLFSFYWSNKLHTV